MAELEIVTPEDLADSIAQVIAGETSRVREGGRFASFDVRLPNGQQFTIQVEELR